MVETINESLRFTEHVLGVRAGATDRIDFYTCPEAVSRSRAAACSKLPVSVTASRASPCFWSRIKVGLPDPG